MATLNIGGKKVKVGDEFLRMTPEQQNAAVEEIAGQLGGQGAQPSAYDQSLARASQMSQSLTPKPQAPAGPDLMGSTAATLGGLVNGIPVVGPMVQKTSDAMVAGGGMLADQITGNQGPDLGGRMKALEDRRAQVAAANPIADLAGNVGGNIATMGGIAAIPGGAMALGMEGGLGARVLNSAISSGGISAADAMSRGGDALQAGAIGGAIGGAIPLVGAGLSAGAKAIGKSLSPTINAALYPGEEAARRVGTAIQRDLTANPSATMNAADQVIARQAGLPLTNIDRGGETTRALARSVANQNPEARAVIQRTVDDRFASQAPRAVDFIKRLTGGAVDDLGYQKSIQNAARMVNKPRYDAAYSAPEAAAVWSPNIRQLMQSDLFRSAISAAESRGTDFAAVSGVKAVRNPFTFGADGSVGLKTLPDGSRALPSLQFWDQVKRNLDGMIGKAVRAGDNQEASVLTQMKSQLVGELDNAVPQYQAARQGAASFFGAEDALDAGKKFATSPKAIPEAQAAFSKFTGAEKQAFSTGYASELIDRIKASSDRRNIIQQVFGSPAAREMNELVFGAGKARQLEAYVRVEALADQLRGAMGNSTTARQLMELGIGGGAGFALTGDWKGAATGALLTKGVRYAGQKVDAQVMEAVAKLLTSDDPSALQRAVANATMSPQWMLALDRLQAALAAPARGTGLAVVGQN